MKTYPVVVRFGGASIQGHIKEMTAAQIGVRQVAMDYQALKDAYDRAPAVWPLLSPHSFAFARQRMSRP